MPGRSRPITLIHTSDVHLGGDYHSTVAQRALSAVVDATIASEADALLIAGDVFDHARVPDSLVTFLIEELSRLQCPAVILPGNHDCLDLGSVYHRSSFAERPNHIHLLDGVPESLLHIEHLDLEIWGRPVVEHRPEFRPLALVPPRRNGARRVVMGHGHYEPKPKTSIYSSPIHPEDIETASCDYIALGHWDRQVDVSHGGVPAYYSGAPQGIGLIDRLGSALVVTIDRESGTVVRPLPLD